MEYKYSKKLQRQQKDGMLNSLLVVWLLCFTLGENYVVLINILYVPVFDGKYILTLVYHRETTANTI